MSYHATIKTVKVKVKPEDYQPKKVRFTESSKKENTDKKKKR